MHCHVDGGYDCGFLASLANRTEAALKEKKKVGFSTGQKMMRADREEETVDTWKNKSNFMLYIRNWGATIA